MVSDAELGKQIKRLTHLPFMPADEADAKAIITEFRRALRSGCKSDSHLQAVVSHLMNTCPPVPPPCEIIAACAEVRTGAMGDGLPEPCERCAALGGTFVDTGRGYGRCSCARGRALQ